MGVYDWDYGAINDGAGGDYFMDSYPHAIKLVEVNPYDDYQGGLYYLIWWDPSANNGSGEFNVANMPGPTQITNKATQSYAVYVTDGVVERVIYDDNSPSAKEIDAVSDKRITAYFSQFSNVLYTSYDTACETTEDKVEPCLDKGDMLFIINSKYTTDNPDPKSATTHTTIVTDSEESGNLYTITKIYKEDPNENTFVGDEEENRYRIVLDKNIPFEGTIDGTPDKIDTASVSDYQIDSAGAKKIGAVNLFKFSPATTGNYEFVSQCSNRGTCDEGLCQCFKGYTNDNCDTQSSLAV